MHDATTGVGRNDRQKRKGAILVQIRHNRDHFNRDTFEEYFYNKFNMDCSELVDNARKSSYRGVLEEYTKDDDKEDDVVEEATAGALEDSDTDIANHNTEEIKENAEVIDVTGHRRRDVKWTLIHGNWHKEVTLNEIIYDKLVIDFADGRTLKWTD